MIEPEVIDNVRYITMSAMQKAIRRNMPTQAVNLGRIFYQCDPDKAWKRLWTILFEDCGRDLNTLWAFYKFRGNGRKFEDAWPLIAQMAKGTKTRETGQVKHIMVIEHLPVWYHATLRASPHARLLEIRQKWHTHKWDCYEPMDFGAGGPDWVVELAERSVKNDWEKMAIGGPFLHLDGIRENNIPFNDTEDEEMWEDMMLLASMDGHTRIGLQALSATAKKFPPPGIDSRRHKLMLFCMEGWLMRNRVRMNAFDYTYHAARFDKIPELHDENFQKFWKETFLPRLNQARRFFMERGEMIDVFKTIKREYHRGYQEVAA